MIIKEKNKKILSRSRKWECTDHTWPAFTDEKRTARTLSFYQAVTKMTSTTGMNFYTPVPAAETYQVTIQDRENIVWELSRKIFLQYTFLLTQVTKELLNRVAIRC